MFSHRQQCSFRENSSLITSALVKASDQASIGPLVVWMPVGVLKLAWSKSRRPPGAVLQFST